MLYRTFGSTGEKVSAIGIGGSRIDLENVKREKENLNAVHYRR